MIRRSILSLVAILALAPAAAEQRLFDDSTPLAVTISAPMTAIRKARQDATRPWFDGSLEYAGADGVAQSLTLKLRTRGHFRRNECFHPPLQLNLKKGEVRDSLWHGQDRLKLVVPCRSGTRAEQWLALEYLTYRAFATLTDLHFRTRWLDITYVDGESGKTRRAPAFVIESEEDTATRLGGSFVAEPPRLQQLDARHAALVEMFQLLIGNNDYSLIDSADGRRCCHNARLLDSEHSAGGLLAIPYDFDHAGIVDADYARPPQALLSEIRSVRRRYFTGRCKSDVTVWNDALAALRRARADIEAVFDDERLNRRTRKEAATYIEDFFDAFDSADAMQRLVVDRCRG